MNYCWAEPENNPGKEFEPEPAYRIIWAEWAAQLSVAPQAFLNSPTVEFSTVTVSGYNLQLDYQPAFIQKKGFGVLDIGAFVGLYPVSPSGVLTFNITSMWSYGTQIKYQARFKHNQTFVPIAGYGIEFFNYQFINGNPQKFFQFGPSLGFLLLLNNLDSQAAASFYNNYGIARTYFFVEARGSSSGDQYLPTESVLAWFYGLRFEF